MNYRQAHDPGLHHHHPPVWVVIAVVVCWYQANTHPYNLYGWTSWITTAIITSIGTILHLALVMGNMIMTLVHDMIRCGWMVHWGRWSVTELSDGSQSVWRCISETYWWFRHPGGLKRCSLLWGCSGRPVIRAIGLQRKGMEVICLEIWVVRIRS